MQCYRSLLFDAVAMALVTIVSLAMPMEVAR
jgi:hypothetical protein